MLFFGRLSGLHRNGSTALPHVHHCAICHKFIRRFSSRPIAVRWAVIAGVEGAGGGERGEGVFIDVGATSPVRQMTQIIASAAQLFFPV